MYWCLFLFQVGVDRIETHDSFENSSSTSHELVETLQENLHRSGSSFREGSSLITEKRTENNMTELVVEDEPGVFITIRIFPDGSKELLRVELR